MDWRKGSVLLQRTVHQFYRAIRQCDAEWRTALTSRNVTGMAKGILMLRGHLIGEEAFTLLTTTSQKANIKPRDLATWLANTANDGAACRVARQ